MPIFEYICRDCKKPFEALLYGAQQAACPHCQGTNLEQQLSVFAARSSAGSAPRASNGGACGACGDPRGPGACSLD